MMVMDAILVREGNAHSRNNNYLLNENNVARYFIELKNDNPEIDIIILMKWFLK